MYLQKKKFFYAFCIFWGKIIYVSKVSNAYLNDDIFGTAVN